MRIAMLSVHSSPLASLGGKEAGGMNVYVRELSRELGRRGVFVDIFTRSQDPRTPAIEHLDERVRVVNLHAGPAAPYDKNLVLTYLPEFVSRIRCFADGEDLQYDLIHSHYWLSGVAGISLRRSWGVPVVHMFHTLAALKNQIARGEEREQQLRVEVEQQVMDQVDTIIAATTLDRKQTLGYYQVDAEKIRIAPCGVDLNLFQPRDQQAARQRLGLQDLPKRMILLVGRIEPLKGIDSLIEAVAILQQRHPEWRGELGAMVVGGASDAQPEQWNAEQRRLDALRKRLGIADSIRFMGAHGQHDLAAFYNAADIVTMPSHYESFGMATLEGMASGRAVVSTAAGGPALIIEDGISGLLVEPNNPQALANQFERILLDAEFQRRLEQGAYQRAEQFSWPSIACDVMQIYRETIEQAMFDCSSIASPVLNLR